MIDSRFLNLFLNDVDFDLKSLNPIRLRLCMIFSIWVFIPQSLSGSEKIRDPQHHNIPAQNAIFADVFFSNILKTSANRNREKPDIRSFSQLRKPCAAVQFGTLTVTRCLKHGEIGSFGVRRFFETSVGYTMIYLVP